MRWLCASSLLLLAACPGSLANPERFTAACADVETELFPASCGSCHGASAPAAGLDLVSPDPSHRMINVAATGGPGLLIDPLNPDGSVLVRKLTPTPPFGSQQPPGAPLEPAGIDCIRAWVRSQKVPALDAGAN